MLTVPDVPVIQCEKYVVSTCWPEAVPGIVRCHPIRTKCVTRRTRRIPTLLSFRPPPSNFSCKMFSRSIARALKAPSSRFFSASAAHQTKVAVLGAGGGIGQPLSLLLKSDPLVTSLSLYDIRGAPGVAADVSHVDTASEVCFILLWNF